MIDISKRLVEVEYILKRLDSKYIKKIPQEIWDYISQNKEKNYIFKYDNNRTLMEQDLNVNTIAILTYINMEYLLNEEQKKDLINLLRKDEMMAEQEKSQKYQSNDVFQNKKANMENKAKNDILLVERKKWYEKIFLFFKNIFKK